MVELTQSRWFGHAVRIGDERHPKIAWQPRTQKERLKGSFSKNLGRRVREYFE
jgi:hypothetical protein